MSENKKENISDFQESHEDRRKILKAKLQQKMERKKIGRLNKGQRQDQLNKYCGQIGITPEQLEQFKLMGEQLKTKK